MVIGGKTMQEYKKYRKRMTLLLALLTFDVAIFVLVYLLFAEVLMITNSFVYFILGATSACLLMYGTLKKLK